MSEYDQPFAWLVFLQRVGMACLVVPAVLTVIRLIRVVASARRRAKLKLGGPEPWCGTCGYSAARSPSPRCPECGTPRLAGTLIRSGDRSRPWPIERTLGAASAIALWSCVTLVVGAPVSDSLRERLQPIKQIGSVESWEIRSNSRTVNVQRMIEFGDEPFVLVSMWDDRGSSGPKYDSASDAWFREVDGRRLSGPGLPRADDLHAWLSADDDRVNLHDLAAAAADCVRGEPRDEYWGVTLRPVVRQNCVVFSWPNLSKAVTVCVGVGLWAAGSWFALRTWRKLVTLTEEYERTRRPSERHPVVDASQRAAELAQSLATLDPAPTVTEMTETDEPEFSSRQTELP